MENAKMRYALVDGEKRLPEKGLRGKCPLCGAPVTSKCGNIKIHHWAHAPGADCDSWSEGKTEWHVDWQNRFPLAWQEVTIEKDGVKHRADVHVPPMANGLESVLEFQHSFLTPEEINAREAFYPNLAWVVDLTHKMREAKRTLKVLEQFPCGVFIQINYPNVHRVSGEGLPENWIDCRWPVFFDFPKELDEYADKLLCLLPRIVGDASRWLVLYQKQEFIDACLNGTMLAGVRQTYSMFADCVIEAIKQREIEKMQKQQPRKFPPTFRRGGWRSPRL